MKHKIEAQWETKSGLKATVLFVNDSHRCGYVEIPKEHPLFQKDYDFKLPVEYWDKLPNETYKGSPINILLAACRDKKDGPEVGTFINVHGGITFSDKPYWAEGSWAFGFDCAHLGDRTSYSTEGELRSLEYVKAECESMAEQLKALENK